MLTLWGSCTAPYKGLVKLGRMCSGMCVLPDNVNCIIIAIFGAVDA